MTAISRKQTLALIGLSFHPICYTFIAMISTKLTMLKHMGITIAVGVPLAVLFLMDEKPDLQTQARNLVPEILTPGRMITGRFDEESGVALFSIDGQIPTAMQSFEASPGSRRHSVERVEWSPTVPMRVYSQLHKDCACFACAKDAQICEMASEWLNKEGSLFYRDSNPQGTSYILNRQDRQIIVVWNRRL